jgi:hypothetical protein
LSTASKFTVVSGCTPFMIDQITTKPVPDDMHTSTN